MAIARPAASLRALRARLDDARDRIVVLDVALETIEEDDAVGGGILAGALAYRLFLFLLPLAFLLVAVLGLAARLSGSSPRSVGKDVGVVGLVSRDVSSAAGGGSGVWVAVSALVVLAYATRVLYRSLGIVHALAWERSASVARSQSRSLPLFALAVAAQVALAAAAGGVGLPTTAGSGARSVLVLAAVAGLWLGVSLVLPHASTRWRGLLPGAVLYGVGILAVHAFDVYVLHFVHRSRENTYGTLGAAAAVLLSLFLVGRLIVATAVLNAVVERRRLRGAGARP